MVSVLTDLQRDVADRLESQLSGWVALPVIVEALGDIATNLSERMQTTGAWYVVRVPSSEGLSHQVRQATIEVVATIDVAANESSTGAKVSMQDMGETVLGALDRWQPGRGGWSCLDFGSWPRATFNEPDRSQLQSTLSFTATTIMPEWKDE